MKEVQNEIPMDFILEFFPSESDITFTIISIPALCTFTKVYIVLIFFSLAQQITHFSIYFCQQYIVL